MLNEEKNYWFYLEPYVHTALKGNQALLYNPLNRKALEIQGKPGILNIIKQFRKKKNALIIKIKENQLQHPENKEFINKVREYFMGDLLEASWFKRKPIQIFPQLRIMKEPGKNPDETFFMGSELMSYLSEISFYLNNGDNRNGKKMKRFRFPEGSKQFLFPQCSKDKNTKLSFQQIKDGMEEISGSSLFRVNILGGNIFCYSKLRELTEYLNDWPVIKAYFFHYLDLGNQDSVKGLKIIAEVRNKMTSQALKEIQWVIEVFIDVPIIKEIWEKALTEIRASGIPVKYHFIIEKDEEIDMSEEIADFYGLSEYSFLPYYNGNNIDFFEEAVFMDKEDIVEAGPTQRDIQIRSVINQNHFGKLTVLSNGNIYANVNEPKLGKLGKNSLYDAVYKEISGGKSWKQTRTWISPCKGCVYQHLCPSPSNYEYAVGKHNLCHIHSSATF